MSISVTQTALVQHLSDLPRGRKLVAFAGPPASGKSTLAEAVARALCADDPDRAVVVPMDGFHFDDQILEERGHRSRKGAPHTFDVDGLRHLLQRLKSNDDDSVAIPLFDRRIEIARAGAAIVRKDVDLVLVEGNYLLLDEAPWDRLASLFDLTVMVEVPEPELRRRLGERWVELGFDEAAITAKLEENDLPNGRLIAKASRPADFVIRNTSWAALD